MDTYKLKWTRMQMEIFRFLCIRAGQTLNLREIARELKVSPTAVSNNLKILKKDNLIKVIGLKNMNLLSIEFNRDNHKALELKRIENLRAVYESGLSDFLFNEFPGCTIILFGSYSRGEDTWSKEKNENSSDVDIAIIGAQKRDLNLKSFEMVFERIININFYNSFIDINKHLKNNLLNGILLQGGIEL